MPNGNLSPYFPLFSEEIPFWFAFSILKFSKSRGEGIQKLYENIYYWALKSSKLTKFLFKELFLMNAHRS
jgi:hypothetical protein